MSTPTPIDPELRGLLEEISRDPRPGLFTQRIPRPVRLARSAPDPISPGSPLLTRAESQLVRLYREETAFLLRAAAETVLQEDEAVRRTTFNYGVGGKPVVVPDRDETMARIAARRSCPGALREPRCDEALDRSLLLLRAGSDKAEQLAALSLTLEPHASAQLLIGRKLLFESEVSAAQCVFSSLAHAERDPRSRGYALSWIGVLAGLRSRHVAAARCYEEATRLNPGLPNSSFSWLACSLVGGDERSASLAAESIADRFPGGSHLDLEWVAARTSERRARLWTTPTAVRSLVQTFTEYRSQTVRRIANGLL